MNPTLLTTALAPLVWGTTYLLTTRYLGDLPAPVLGLMRILPAGILLMLIARKLPPKGWWGRIATLALLRQGLFFTLLYASALHLPGGVAATIGASSAMLVVLLAWPLLGQKPAPWLLGLAALGFVGVGLISLSGGEHLDLLGVVYALGFAGVNALGTALFGRWGPPPASTPLQQMAWELVLGGLMLLPVAWAGLPALAQVDTVGWEALAFMSLIGTALAAIIWQRGLNLLPVQQVSLLAPLSPLTAVILDIIFVGKILSPMQWLGATLVLGSVLLSGRRKVPKATPKQPPSSL